MNHLALLALLTGCIATAPARPDPEPSASGAPASADGAAEVQATPAVDEAPLHLVVEQRGERLLGTVHNRADHPVAVLVSSRLQPVDLEVRGPEGEPRVPFDSRSREKFDPHPREGEFVLLQPGEARLVQDARLLRRQDGYELRWPPYEFDGLSPGRYDLRAAWGLTATAWFDDDGRSHPVPDAWVGVVHAPPLAIELEADPVLEEH